MSRGDEIQSENALVTFGSERASEGNTQHSLSSSSPLRAYADANWGGCPDTRRSTTGWMIMLGSDILDWQSRKQTTVALSTCEAEYMAISAAAQAVAWTRGFLSEIKEFESAVIEESRNEEMRNSGGMSAVPILFSDNRAAIAMARNDVLHNRSKHIDIKHHFIREQLDAGLITLEWISTTDQLADALTKSLPPRTFCNIRDRLVVPRPTH